MGPDTRAVQRQTQMLSSAKFCPSLLFSCDSHVLVPFGDQSTDQLSELFVGELLHLLRGMRRGGPRHPLHLHGKEAQHQLPDALHLPVGWVRLHGSANGRSRARLRRKPAASAHPGAAAAEGV